MLPLLDPEAPAALPSAADPGPAPADPAPASSPPPVNEPSVARGKGAEVVVIFVFGCPGMMSEVRWARMVSWTDGATMTPL